MRKFISYFFAILLVISLLSATHAFAWPPAFPATINATNTNLPATGFESAENLFTINNNKWCYNHVNGALKGRPSTTNPYIFTWSYPQPVVFDEYRVMTANDVVNAPGRNPSSWVLYGSATGVTGPWTVINTQTNAALPVQAYAEKTYALSATSAPYQYYQLRITGNGSASDWDAVELSYFLLDVRDPNVVVEPVIVSPAADKDFGLLPLDYNPSNHVHSVTATNKDSKATALSIALSGTNTAAFATSKTTTASLAPNASEAFTVTLAPNMPIGNYKATVTVNNSDNRGVGFDVSYGVTYRGANPQTNGAAWGSETADKLFDGLAATKWYVPTKPSVASPLWLTWEYSKRVYVDSYTITTANDSDGRDPSSWILYGAENPGGPYTEIDRQNAPGLPADRGALKTYSINPTSFQYFKLEITGVKGEYTNDFQLSGFMLRAQDPTYNIAIRPIVSHDFGVKRQGYVQPTPHAVTVWNLGYSGAPALPVYLTGNNPDAFELSKASIPNLAAGTRDRFTVVPKGGLNPGIYTAIVNVENANGGFLTLSVRFEVKPPNAFSLGLDFMKKEITVTGSDFDPGERISVVAGYNESALRHLALPNNMDYIGQIKADELGSATTKFLSRVESWRTNHSYYVALNGTEKQGLLTEISVEIIDYTETLVYGYPANVVISVRSSLDSVTVWLTGKDGVRIGDELTISSYDGTVVFSLSADHIPEAGLAILTVHAKAGTNTVDEKHISTVSEAGLWEMAVSDDAEGLVLRFGTKIAFDGNVTIDGNVISAGNIIVGDDRLIVKGPYTKAGLTGKTIVAEGVSYPSLFPSYSFTFTTLVV